MTLAGIAILVLLAQNHYGYAIAKAARVESIQNINRVKANVEAAIIENVVDVDILTNQWGAANSGGGSATLHISGPEHDTPTACHIPNPFGFQIEDCMKVRYEYEVILNADGGYFIIAYSDRVNPLCRSPLTVGGVNYAYNLDVMIYISYFGTTLELNPLCSLYAT